MATVDPQAMKQVMAFTQEAKRRRRTRKRLPGLDGMRAMNRSQTPYMARYIAQRAK